MTYGHLLPSGLLTDTRDVILGLTNKSAQWRLRDIQRDLTMFMWHTAYEDVQMDTHSNSVFGLQTALYSVFLLKRPKVTGLQFGFSNTHVGLIGQGKLMQSNATVLNGSFYCIWCGKQHTNQMLLWFYIYIYYLAVFRKAENAFFNALAVFLQFYIFIDITLLTLL